MILLWYNSIERETPISEERRAYEKSAARSAYINSDCRQQIVRFLVSKKKGFGQSVKSKAFISFISIYSKWRESE